MTASLADLEILVLDCQTTGNHPRNGHLLEIGWQCCRPSDQNAIRSSSITSHLIKLPDGVEIPRRIHLITGICQDDLGAASSPEAVWSKLVETAGRIAATSQTKACPTVIHYCRFEEPFLRELHRRSNDGSAFPFDFFCTHEITKRLFPGLPRRGIRAIAGYFGYSMPELKRCDEHVAATAAIWKNLVKQLAAGHGVRTLDELRDWLIKTSAPSRSDRIYPMDPNIRSILPDHPGVYRMLRSNGDSLYIGKAKSLKQRVNSYFQKSIRHPEHILEMLSQAVDLEVLPTGSAMEAAILESDQIKSHCPPYNIALRKQHRNLWFCSRDFRRFSLISDNLHCHGPLPSKEPLLAFHSIAELIESGGIETITAKNASASAVIGIPEEYAPLTDVFKSGFRCFCLKNGPALKNKPAYRALITIGTQLWRESIAESEVGTDTPAENSSGDEQTQAINDKTPSQKDWTPESVSTAMESVIKRCAYWLRRSRWLCLLSESALAWETHHNTGEQILIVFKKGAIIDRRVLQVGQQLPLPPGYKTDFSGRRQNLDLKTYDRLRVVTTELRRLLSEQRSVKLRLGLKSVLRAEQLRKALKWV